MSKDEKSVMLQNRSTKQLIPVTPAAWAKMKAQGKEESYKEVTAPAIPKEVAAKVVNDKKLSGKLNPESDQHHDSNTKTAEHLG